VTDRPTGVSRALHLGVLWSFAVAKPLLDVLADDPAFLVARDLSAGEIVLLALGLTLVPPLAMAGLEWALGRLDQRLGDAAHLGLIGLLVALLAIQLAKEAITGPAGLLFALALGAGAGFAFLYARGSFLPNVLTVLSPAPLLFVALFLFTGTTSELVLPGRGAEAPAKRVGSDAPVVLVVFDEFPLASLLDGAGRIDASRYPSFATLAQDATWYRDATTVASATYIAVPAILSGLPQTEKVPPIVANYPRNLFTQLDGHREMNVIEPVTSLCPDDVCPESRDSFGQRMGELITDLGLVEAHKLLPDSLADDLPPVDEGFEHFLDDLAAPKIVADFDSFAGEVKRHPEGLHFMHLPLVPHSPWRYLPDGHRYPDEVTVTDTAAERVLNFADQPPMVMHMWQRHLLQVGFADLLLGRLLDSLRRSGAYDRSLVIVTADHGTAFLAGKPRRVPIPSTMPGIARVPLFVKAPGQSRGRVSRQRICTSDILPLIGRILDFSPRPEGVECPPGEATVFGYNHTLSIPLRVLERGLGGLVARQTALFGSNRGWGTVYGFGDRWGLIGRSVGELQRVPPGDAAATLIGAGPERAFGPDDELVGASVRAQVSGGGLDPADRVAIAVGGRIEAIGFPYEIEGEDGVAGILPPKSLNRGEIELFLIVGGESVALQPIPLANG
jgi:hypothetical protein